jgi:hypothetical protein
MVYRKYLTVYRIWDSSVDIVTRLWARRLRNRGFYFPCYKNILSSPKRSEQLSSPRSLLFSAYRRVRRGTNPSDSEADRSLPSSADIRTTGCIPPLPPPAPSWRVYVQLCFYIILYVFAFKLTSFSFRCFSVVENAYWRPNVCSSVCHTRITVTLSGRISE